MPIAALLFGLALSALVPDEIIFKNGEKIVGKITSVADGKITIVSDSMGTVSAPLDKIATFSADQDLTLVLKGGTTVKQKVVGASEGNIKLAGAEPIQAQSVPISSIDKINPPPVKWTGSVVAGYTATRGNADTDAANLDANAVRRSDDDRLNFSAGYFSTRQKDTSTSIYKTTAERYYGAMQYDYFFSKVVYAYANARAEKDRIAFLDLRFLAGAGAGQQWAETGTFSFATEEGVAWLSENYTSNTPTNDTLTLRLAYRLKYKPSDTVTFFHNVDWYPGIESTDDQFVIADAGVNASLTASMFAQAKVEVRYDNTPAPGAERMDTRYVFGVGWSF